MQHIVDSDPRRCSTSNADNLIFPAPVLRSSDCYSHAAAHSTGKQNVVQRASKIQPGQTEFIFWDLCAPDANIQLIPFPSNVSLQNQARECERTLRSRHPTSQRLLLMKKVDTNIW
jgi:hypothetical protein